MKTRPKISKTSILICSRCKKKNTAEDWDDMSMSYCVSREMSRSYNSLLKETNWKKNGANLYCCPNCRAWVGVDAIIRVLSQD